MNKSAIGVYGLGVMGRNLALNLEDHGNQVTVYNRSVPGEEKVVSDFIESEGKSKSFIGAQSPLDFAQSLESPRKILIMVKAGPPVDSVIDELIPFLDQGDILIDGGNSHFEDTERRASNLAEEGIRFVGMGVSGGEEGARFGPSMMPGTTIKTWLKLKPLFEPIAAKAFDSSPCITRIGTGGAGHFVKMVHNGIEYADMQLIAEAYHIMKQDFQMSAGKISDQFSAWNSGLLSSYLFEITADILSVSDDDDNPLVEKILDSAGQKGTGKWTAISAFENGIPLPGISGSVTARFISSFTDLRRKLSSSETYESTSANEDINQSLAYLADALLASRVVSHAEGFFLIAEMNRQKEWEIDPAEIARIWQGGCIIRSELLKTIVKAYKKEPALNHLLQSDIVSELLKDLQGGWRNTISRAAISGTPVPVMMSSLSQYDSLRSARLPANLIQAQRDYFGAHTYERTDKPRGKFFHTEWKGNA
ncbi:decarboxylating NADP(+)-dependent phosphogluconate dehydrogenase [Rhodohalobacter sp. 8-1]|uniref:decarboxylating NADP(+)-dependent phosphogluconate dehydrogenase n=1 Tax=Rhodohalobacter sp. 8-1 TaxID=3131972 RepID=UPI0030EB8815